jgi:ABC-type Mn2+/Zn2+ transport system ATPase subunit
VDAETRDIIYDLMRELRDEGKTLLVATHELDRLVSAFDATVSLQAGELAPPLGDGATTPRSSPSALGEVGVPGGQEWT